LWWKYYIVFYEKGKVRHTETIPGMVGGTIKENDGGNEFSYDLLSELL
jgi:hypothetical protein